MPRILANISILAALFLTAANGNVARAEGRTLNACGCYTENETCFCEKKAKCGCPGECEPKGCEVERQKKFQKEIEAETKRAAEEAEAAAKARGPKVDDTAKAEEKAEEKDAAAAKAAAEPAKAPAAGKTAPVHKMTAAQEKQLLRLLDAYVAEHPGASGRTATEIRGELQ
jgi:hypothetical protein